MSDLKQVKVDNWGIYFLQRLKHFFNRTDYCDLTLQFQDNAQLKVHRLVLNACTEYFELLERTCEMYEDCLVMPDDLQADVMVPIVNFMYTGQLEFKMNHLEKLYQTSLIMNMPVLSKLLKAHRGIHSKSTNISPAHSFSGMKKYTKSISSPKPKYVVSAPGSKRSFSKAFENIKPMSNKNIPVVSNKTPEYIKPKQPVSKLENLKEAKTQTQLKKQEEPVSNGSRAYRPPSPIPLDLELYSKRLVLGDPRPTRYELPEELDTDNIFESSFSSISYTSAPLMVHPDTTKQYSSKKHIFNDGSGSKKSFKSSTVDIVECKKITRNDNLFEDDVSQNIHDEDIFQSAYLSVQDNKSQKDSNQLFDQILDTNEGPKVTIEAKDKQAGNLDHAKIISEVLKKYPHLVKSNKNIKLKILNTPSKVKKPRSVTPQPIHIEPEVTKQKSDISFTYETDVLDSKEAAKLIAKGAENIKGPWICLICGTPGKALNFTSYYNFRRHLVEVHNEKPISTICEYCGLKSMKRNYLLHHIYTRHGVPPPPQYTFPKCNMCGYVALTEGFLVKHKLTHADFKNVRCTVCSAAFSTTTQLQIHMQKTGHNNVDKKSSLQCPYCMRVFLRETNYFAHIKTNHAEMAIRDGIIEDSDDEKQIEEKHRPGHEMLKSNIKYEQQNFDIEYEDAEQLQYQIQHIPDGEMHVNKKPKNFNVKHKILNPGFSMPSTKPAHKIKSPNVINNKYIQEIESLPSQSNEENIVVIDNNEYVMQDNQLIPRQNNTSTDFMIPDLMGSGGTNETLDHIHNITPTTPMEFTEIHPTNTVQSSKIKKPSNTQPIQIVVSNEEEYKALMASNHSIIFDDGETNETLTVLTGHDNSIDNSTIKIETSQPNDMMIIQEDYAMNASETVTADSKYVVVYSHTVGHDSNKQYQILTPQEIGPQYVQTSEVVTQNFETVTTSAPVLNAHLIEAQIEEAWPDNVQHNIDNSVLQVGSETEIRSLAKADQPTEKVLENSMVELPEVQLSITVSEPVKDRVDMLEHIQNNEHVTINDNVGTLQHIQNDEHEPLKDNVSLQSIHNNENETLLTSHHVSCNTQQVIIEEIQSNTEESMDVEISSEIISQKEIVKETETVNLPGAPQDNLTDDSMLKNDDQHGNLPPSERINITMDYPEENNDCENTANLTTKIIDNIHSQENTKMSEIPVNNEIVTKPLPTVEQIKNITSEWSEDEYDTIIESAVDTKKSESQLNPEPELEESIENIQQEMQKQLAESIADTLIVDSNVTCPKQTHEPDTNVHVEATEKISSLLNEWDDSQEDNDAPKPSETIHPDEDKMSDSTRKNDKENDNIKRLVSDWDDDDEEHKE